MFEISIYLQLGFFFKPFGSQQTLFTVLFPSLSKRNFC